MNNLSHTFHNFQQMYYTTTTAFQLCETTLHVLIISVLYRYENGSAYYHEDDRDGLLKVCRLVINTHYEDYVTEGFTVLSSKQPVIYQSAACRPGLGQHLCSQVQCHLQIICIGHMM